MIWGNMLNYKEIDPSKCEFVSVAGIDEIADEERIFIEIDDNRIVLFKIAGNFFAIGDVCSHDDGPLGDGELESDFKISCPRHGARFDIRTGKALSLPAVEDIPAFPIRILDSEIQIGLPTN